MEPGRRVTRAALWTGAALLAGLAAWQAASALQETADDPAGVPAATEQPAAPPANPGTTTPRAAAPALPGQRTATPMAERVATIGILNKRNGLSRDLTMKPGDAVRIGDLVVRLRACDATAPWEPERWTGAFVQVITREARNSWRKTFSGWLYKESPSLNVVEHPIYDVWVKDCKMRHPEIGPATIVARGEDAGAAKSRSNADKSPTTEEAPSSPSPESAAARAAE